MNLLLFQNSVLVAAGRFSGRRVHHQQLRQEKSESLDPLILLLAARILNPKL